MEGAPAGVTQGRSSDSPEHLIALVRAAQRGDTRAMNNLLDALAPFVRPPRINVSGHVYDVDTGLLQTILPADRQITPETVGDRAVAQSSPGDAPLPGGRLIVAEVVERDDDGLAGEARYTRSAACAGATSPSR
jgi:hypothetical protein